jgi:prepilin-type N-terminal cleavage/methylation domain-containing protein
MPIRRDADAGFTLIEMLVVVGLIVVVIATLGAFFLGGPSPAVASAARDIDAAFHEARETAVAAGAATVVFTPAGSGYTARVYRQAPGDAAFAAVNGPAYASTVTIRETAAPLGAPGFAFRVDLRGSVTAYEHFAPGDTAFDEQPCPPTGAFTLALAVAQQQRAIAVPCTLTVASLVAVDVTPSPAMTPAPYTPGTCPASQSCTASLPPFSATCPPGYTPDTTQPNVCDSPTPLPTTTPTATAQPSTTTVGATPSPTPMSTGTPNYTWTAVLNYGAHEAAGAWYYWVEVDIDYRGSYIAEACFGAKSGTTVNWPTVLMSSTTSLTNLEALSVPEDLASTVLSNCGTYRFGANNPLVGAF